MFTVNPLQAVSETQRIFWEQFTCLQQGIGDQIRREESQLQIELCHLSPQDPQFFEKLMRIGPGARVFFRRYPFYLCLSFHPALHSWVLAQLDVFVNRFQAMTNAVREAAHIPPQEWDAEEYSHDLAEVVAIRYPLPQLMSAAELVPQVMAAHEIRCNASQSQTQMS